jgi:hypothetical protein
VLPVLIRIHLPEDGNMAESIKNISQYSNAGYSNIAPQYQRAYAVGAALEIITARATSSNGIDLTTEFSNLSKYADQIQAALKVE